MGVGKQNTHQTTTGQSAGPLDNLASEDLDCVGHNHLHCVWQRPAQPEGRKRLHPFSSSRAFWRVVLGFTALTLGLVVTYVATRGTVTVEKMASAGPHGVGYRRTLVRDSQRDRRAVPVDCWYPIHRKSVEGRRAFYVFAKTPFKNLGLLSTTAVQDAAAEFPQPMALIIFSHGYRGSSIESVRLMETLASHGFIVMAPMHRDSPAGGARQSALGEREKEICDRVADVRCVLRTATQILPQSSSNGQPFEVAAFGLVGDSRGAATILSVAAEHGPTANPPLKAVMLIAPAQPASGVPGTLASITTPTLLVGGTLDTVTPVAANVVNLFRGLGSQPVYCLVIEGASHFHFMNIKDIGEAMISLGLPKWLWPWIGARALTKPYEACIDPASESVGIVQTTLSRYGSAFFRRHLLGQHDTEDILSSVLASQASGTITLQVRANRQ